MRQLESVRWPGLVRTGLALLVLLTLGASWGGGTGCTLLLDTGGNPYKCTTTDDCVRFPNAVCDDVRKICVPRLPFGGQDGGGGTSGLTCELSFDNSTRIHLFGPDGGLQPLPEGP